ncbi:sugar phosphate isomerase/epimerase family protein [Streptomyces sp. NPDC097595]|uniref:sugar phosphate isomerase/epimerase family protein n=1 Tax=Streptomyces sp. NPDC097595 TaxID=3366090 RepID=UPI0037FF8483
MSVTAAGVGPERLCGIGDEAAAGLLDQIRVHRELGFHALEVRSLDGVGLHNLPEDSVRAIAETLTAVGMVVPVLDTPIGSWAVSVTGDFGLEIDILRRATRRALLLGCRTLRVMSYPNDGLPEGEWRTEVFRRMRHLTGLAEDAGVVLLHENCNGWAGQGAQQSLDLVTSIDSPALRLLFDIGNGLAYGYDSLEFLRQTLPWVEHVHVKDGVRDADGSAVFGLPGEGAAHVRACMELLENAGYRGWYSIEPHVALIPHLGISADGAEMESAYTAYGRRFTELASAVATVPAAPFARRARTDA